MIQRVAWVGVIAAMVLSGIAARPALAQAWPAIDGELPRAGGGEHDVAVIVGVDQYLLLPHVPGAAQNAADWHAYLTRVRGIPAERVVLLRDKEATKEKIERALQSTAALVEPGSTAWFVWAGHGAPAPTGDDGLLLGADTMADADSVGARGLPQARVLAVLEANKPAQVVAVFDACFSGMTSYGDAPLVEGQQATLPLRRLVETTSTTIFSASPTFAGALPGTKRPALSYTLLGALRGWADGNGDRFVTQSEAFTFTRDTMLQALKGSDRLPSVAGGTSSMVLASSAAEPAPDVGAIVTGSCPPGTGWSGRRCEAGLAPPPPQVATRTIPETRAPRSRVEQVLDDTFQNEAIRLCADPEQPGEWWYCTRKTSFTENQFIVAYRKEVGANDLDDKMVLGGEMDFLLPIGLGAAGVGGAIFGLAWASGALEPDRSESAGPALGVVGVGVVFGTVAAGLGLMSVLAPPEQRIQDQPVTFHQLSKPQALNAVTRHNAALHKRLRTDAGLEEAETPDVELAVRSRASLPRAMPNE